MSRAQERKQGLEELKSAISHPEKCLVIHYSCESFFNPVSNNPGISRSPRVTSVCIRNYNSAQATSFSIHLQAQFSGVQLEMASEQEYDDLERRMLSEFYEYVKNNRACAWLHWNMRDSNFGFEAIANRYRILGGNPEVIDEHRKFDLSRILGKIYSYSYEVNKPAGRLLNLAARNGMTRLNAVPGKEEALLFENKKYLELHLSTLRKVAIISGIAEKAHANKLKVNASLVKVYGLSVEGVGQIIKSSWFLFILVFVLGLTLRSVFQMIWKSVFGN